MLKVITWWWPKEELEDPCPLHLSPEKARPDTYGWTSNSSLTWGLLGKIGEMAVQRLKYFSTCLIFLMPIRHQVPKCWKVLSPDGHVQCHTWDCQLCMWVLYMTLHSCTLWCLCCYWRICIQLNVQLYFTVTTLKPEIGKINYEDYKQVWECIWSDRLFNCSST